MANANLYFPKVLKFEGGYQCDNKDTGNYLKGVLIGTNKGVTPATYLQAFKRVPTVDDMKSLTDEQVRQVMKILFWDYCWGDHLKNQSVAEVVVDWFWGSGFTGIKEIQRVVGVIPDGKFGRLTYLAINSQDQQDLFNRLQSARKDFLNRICIKRPDNKKFLKGWLNRVNSFTFEII